MAILGAVLFIAGIALPSAVLGGWVAIWSLRRSILDDIRAEKAGDLAE